MAENLAQSQIDDLFKEIDTYEGLTELVNNSKISNKNNDISYVYKYKRNFPKYVKCKFCGNKSAKTSLLFRENYKPLVIIDCDYCNNTTTIGKLNENSRRNKR